MDLTSNSSILFQCVRSNRHALRIVGVVILFISASKSRGVGSHSVNYRHIHTPHPRMPHGQGQSQRYPRPLCRSVHSTNRCHSRLSILISASSRAMASRVSRSITACVFPSSIVHTCCNDSIQLLTMYDARPRQYRCMAIAMSWSLVVWSNIIRSLDALHGSAVTDKTGPGCAVRPEHDNGLTGRMGQATGNNDRDQPGRNHNPNEINPPSGF
ncbi:hypothetical protein [Caudoviricetes sp.]|nr:hypothetical protein [Caudoviricetes sp.]UOF79857.1 hypothetical protein [Bacteriophage sp.]